MGFKDIRSKTIRPKWDFESPEEYFNFYLESKNPEFMRGYQPWWDKGMESTMRPMFERIVRKNYNGAKDFDMKVFLFIARKCEKSILEASNLFPYQHYVYYGSRGLLIL